MNRIKLIQAKHLSIYLSFSLSVTLPISFLIISLLMFHCLCVYFSSSLLTLFNICLFFLCHSLSSLLSHSFSAIVLSSVPLIISGWSDSVDKLWSSISLRAKTFTTYYFKLLSYFFKVAAKTNKKRLFCQKTIWKLILYSVFLSPILTTNR